MPPPIVTSDPSSSTFSGADAPPPVALDLKRVERVQEKYLAQDTRFHALRNFKRSHSDRGKLDTAAYRAAKAAEPDDFDLLLLAGAKIWDKDALSAVVKNNRGDAEKVRRVIQKLLDKYRESGIPLPQPPGEPSLLHLAARNGNGKALSVLIADPETRQALRTPDADGRKPIDIFLGGSPGFAEQLGTNLSDCFDPDDPIFQEVVSDIMDRPEPQLMAFMAGLLERRPDLARLLIAAADAKPASADKAVRVVEMLLEKSPASRRALAMPDDDGLTAMDIILDGPPDAAKRFGTRFAELYDPNEPVLREAIFDVMARSDDKAVAFMTGLLERRKPLVNLVDERGAGLLHAAVNANGEDLDSENMIRLLLARGIDTDARVADWTPYETAVADGHLAAVLALRDRCDADEVAIDEAHRNLLEHPDHSAYVATYRIATMSRLWLGNASLAERSAQAAIFLAEIGPSPHPEAEADNRRLAMRVFGVRPEDEAEFYRQVNFVLRRAAREPPPTILR